MRVVKRLLGIAVFGGVMVLGWRFAAKNSSPVTVDVIVTQFADVSLWLMIVITFGVGVAVASLAGMYKVARQGMTVRRYRKTVRSPESEVHQLRNLPLGEEGGPGDGSGGGSAAAPASLEEALERGT